MVSSLIVTIILISVLVIAHEFGHFIVAKKSGICVQIGRASCRERV